MNSSDTIIPTYNTWLSHGEKPIVRLHDPWLVSNTRYNYDIYSGFDILQKFKLLLNNPVDIENILEARLTIGFHATTLQLNPKQFVRVSDFCYELNFINETTTNAPLLIPLIAIQYHKNINLTLFVKNKCTINPQILCEYYDLPTNVRREVAAGTWEINTNHSYLRIMRGMCGFVKCQSIYSFHFDNDYNLIHDKLYQEYLNQKLLQGKSFEFKINYNNTDLTLTISEEIFEEIIRGLSFEWDVYYQKDNKSGDFIIYF
jgi:hypothetical protein